MSSNNKMPDERNKDIQEVQFLEQNLQNLFFKNRPFRWN